MDHGVEPEECDGKLFDQEPQRVSEANVCHFVPQQQFQFAIVQFQGSCRQNKDRPMHLPTKCPTQSVEGAHLDRQFGVDAPEQPFEAS